MLSPSVHSIGADVQFMAVSIGYDINVNKIFGGSGKDRSKSRFSFEFSSALLSGRYYSIKNDNNTLYALLYHLGWVRVGKSRSIFL